MDAQDQLKILLGDMSHPVVQEMYEEPAVPYPPARHSQFHRGKNKDIRKKILEILADYKTDAATYKNKTAYLKFKSEFPNSAPLHEFYMKALAKNYTEEQRRAMHLWTLYGDGLLRGIPKKDDLLDENFADIVGVNICLLTSDGVRNLRTYNIAPFNTLLNKLNVKGIEFTNFMTPTSEARFNTLSKILNEGHVLVPYKPWKQRHRLFRLYIEQLLAELQLKFTSDEDAFTIDDILRNKNTTKLEQNSEEARNLLLGFMKALRDVLVEPLEECAVEVDVGRRTEGVPVTRVTWFGNPPKCGLRACSVASQILTGFKGDDPKSFSLQNGVLVVPALLLYVNRFLAQSELEMLVVNGYYSMRDDTIVPDSRMLRTFPMSLRNVTLRV